MPTVLDATVVNSAYQTSASARPQYLSNGWIVTAEYNANNIYLQVNKLDGAGFIPLCSVNGYSAGGFAVTKKGTDIYVIVNSANNIYFWRVNALTQTNVDVGPNSVALDPSQTGFSGLSLTINEAGTELHATWASKNATLANSMNVRYAKGTINADGSVTWGAVEQVTKVNATNNFFQNPSILPNGKIVCEYYNTVSYYMVIFDKSWTNYFFLNSIVNWGNYNIYQGNSYTQSSPSAIFVPQSVNGLANGRIWVAWFGKDATDSSVNNIRVSYSDDGGVTWSAMQKLTTGNVYSHAWTSMTANKNGEVFVLWNGNSATSPTYNRIMRIKWNGTSWGSVLEVTNNSTGHVNFPSALFDLTVNFSEPLFIYQNSQTAKVGFYGTWTVTTISVTQGSIGQKSDKNNLLSYVITTDGTMSAITEKVNGVTIGTKTATSGAPLIAGLTQEQWDAVRFGKYADATGGQNTLTIEMGSEKWTYTFDKRPATDSDIISAVKAVKDSQEVYIPSVKAKLASAVRSKGGSVNDADSFEAIEQAVKGITLNKPDASGTVMYNNTTTTISGLSFAPRFVIIYPSNNLSALYVITRPSGTGVTNSSAGISSKSLNSDGFSWMFTNGNATEHTWHAFA